MVAVALAASSLGLRHGDAADAVLLLGAAVPLCAIGALWLPWLELTRDPSVSAARRTTAVAAAATLPLLWLTSGAQSDATFAISATIGGMIFVVTTEWLRRDALRDRRRALRQTHGALGRDAVGD